MSKPDNSKSYDLSDIRAREVKARNGDTIKFTLDGEKFVTPAPGFFPDEMKRAARDGDDDQFMLYALGPDLSRFREHGGSSDMLGLLYGEYAKDQGASLGESPA